MIDIDCKQAVKVLSAMDDYLKHLDSTGEQFMVYCGKCYLVTAAKRYDEESVGNCSVCGSEEKTVRLYPLHRIPIDYLTPRPIEFQMGISYGLARLKPAQYGHCLSEFAEEWMRLPAEQQIAQIEALFNINKQIDVKRRELEKLEERLIYRGG